MSFLEFSFFSQREKAFDHFSVKILVILPFFLSISSGSFGQNKRVDVFVSNGVFTADSTISTVLKTWEGYLNSRPDNTYDNPYWNADEKQRYKTFDLSSEVFYPSLYLLMQNYKPTVLSISEVKPYYKIRTIYSSIADSNFADPLAIQEVYAKRENGIFKLYNALPIRTKTWRHETIGSVTFIFPAYHRFNRELAKRMSHFADSLSVLTETEPIPVDFYFADSYDELMKARGLDFQMGEGNASGVSGLSWTDNRIIFGAGTNEWYPHELVHIYFSPRYPKMHSYFSEGIATMLGGTRGMSLAQLIDHADTLLKTDTTIRFDSLLYSWNTNLDYITGAPYLVGGLLIKMALDQGGWPLVKKLLVNYDNTPKGLLQAVKDTFNVRREDYDHFIKQKISEYSAK